MKIIQGAKHLGRAIAILGTLSLDHALQAQILPDTTLPSNSRITIQENRLTIEGGTSAGGNLFHSFSEFSLPTGSEAYFNNATTVKNIIGRVTGSSISQIDGLIRANGNANLFLLNPNGIFFGPNASLNIGGSFLASTANSLEFSDGSEFSATHPSASPLLSITTPIGLYFRENPGEINVQGTGHSLQRGDKPLIFYTIKRTNSMTGLQVKPGNTLALVGGRINLDGGVLTAENGQIELGSVDAGRVGLHSIPKGWTLSYEGVKNFREIRLTQYALVDASGVESGSIQVQGSRITVSNGSVIFLENQGTKPSGSININASESFTIEVTRTKLLFPTLVFSQAIAQGTGADINIVTQQLVTRGGVNIDALTLGNGAKGGDIHIDASDSIKMFGGATNDSIIARTQNTGNAGHVFVSTHQLTILNGSNILSASNLGTGNAGDVKINASHIELIGIAKLNIETTVAIVPSLIASVTRDGDASNVEINTSTLILRDGGQINTSTLSKGDAGSLTINASEWIKVSGTVPDSINPTQIISAANVLDPAQQKLFMLPPIPTGASGQVTLNTPQLIITDGAEVSVRNDGFNRAGNLRINADSIFLDRWGGITASSASGQGGNITLNVQNILQLRHNSQISATSKGTGDGGNMTIDTRFLIGADNSDITANSRRGRGGGIDITAAGIIGFFVQDNRLTSGNDITAFSQLGTDLKGTIELNTPEIDPSRGLIEFPTIVIDPTTLIAQNPCTGGTTSELTRTGRGGLPSSVNQDLSNNATQVELVEPVPIQKRTPEADKSSNIDSRRIEPAQGWIFNEKGEVVLTEYNPSITEPQRLRDNSATCSKSLF